jgi:hypothetical protein
MSGDAAGDGVGRRGRRRRRLGGRHDDVVAHLGAEHLGLPAEGLFEEAGDALAVLARQFEVHDGIHGGVLSGGDADAGAPSLARRASGPEIDSAFA